MARLARRRSAQRTLGMRMRSSAARIARIAITTTTQSGKLTCEPMQNPDPASPATPRAAAPRRHDTVWNSVVTSLFRIPVSAYGCAGVCPAYSERQNAMQEARVIKSVMPGRCSELLALRDFGIGVRFNEI
jgi:hypothetical protein